MRLLLPTLACVFGMGPAAWAAAPPPSRSLLSGLVRDLGDDDFETRQVAAARLRGWAAAIPLLEEASFSKDAERSSAARKLLGPFEPGRAREACRRMGVLLSEGRFDLLPDHAVRWGPPGPVEFPFEAASFAAGLCQARAASLCRARPGGEADRHLTWSMRLLPFKDILLGEWRGRKWRRDRDVRYSDLIDASPNTQAFYAANTIRTDFNWNGVFLSTGNLICQRVGPSDSIVIAGADVSVEAKHGVSNCIIVCDGAVTLSASSVASIIIARKGIVIKAKNSTENVLSSRSKVEIHEEDRKRQYHLIQEDAKRPLGLVRFFEPSDVGLTLDSTAVKAIDPGCPLAVAGLRVGDVFEAIDAVAVKDADHLRRALRKRFAIDGVGLFSVKRGGKTLILPARLAE